MRIKYRIFALAAAFVMLSSCGSSPAPAQTAAGTADTKAPESAQSGTVASDGKNKDKDKDKKAAAVGRHHRYRE